jgi:hypothetical protein
MRKDDLLLFGSYRWRVLAVEDRGVLIITEGIVALRWYHDAFVNVTWAACALRQYLNHAFYPWPTPTRTTRGLAPPAGRRPRTASFC